MDEVRPFHPDCDCVFENEDAETIHGNNMHSIVTEFMEKLGEESSEYQICAHNSMVIVAVMLKLVSKLISEDSLEQSNLVDKAMWKATKLMEQDDNAGYTRH